MEDTSHAQPIESRQVWIRGLFMLLFALAFGIAQMVLNVIAIVQFIWLLIQRERNEYLVRFGASLSNWLAEVARFQTGASDEKPFPWRPWP
jgi:hypothetical protein